MFCQGIFWNSHHFLVSVFISLLLFFDNGWDWVSWGWFSLLYHFPYDLGFFFHLFCGGFVGPNYHLLFSWNFDLFWHHTDKWLPMKRWPRIPSLFGCNKEFIPLIYFRKSVTLCLWYPYLCLRYKRYLCTLSPLGPSLNAKWSIFCTDHHSFP